MRCLSANKTFKSTTRRTITSTADSRTTLGIHRHGLFRTRTEVSIRKRHDPYCNRSVDENGKVYSDAQHSYQQRNSGPVPTRSISASRTTIEYRIGSRPPFYRKILGCLTEGIRCAIANVDGRTPSDRRAVRSCRQGNSEAAETVCVSGTGLGGIAALPRIREQRTRK